MSRKVVSMKVTKKALRKLVKNEIAGLNEQVVGGMQAGRKNVQQMMTTMATPADIDNILVTIQGIPGSWHGRAGLYRDVFYQAAEKGLLLSAKGKILIFDILFASSAKDQYAIPRRVFADNNPGSPVR